MGGGSHLLYPNGSVCADAHRPAFFTPTGAGGEKMRGGVLSLALVGLSPTSTDGFRAHHALAGRHLAHTKPLCSLAQPLDCYTLNQPNVYPKPFVDQILKVNFLFICQLTHKVIYIRFKVNWEAELGIRSVKLTTLTFGKTIFCPHRFPPRYSTASLSVALRAEMIRISYKFSSTCSNVCTTTRRTALLSIPIVIHRSSYSLCASS